MSELNLNYSVIEVPPIHKLNSSPFMSNYGQNFMQVRDNRTVVHRNYDKVSVYTQPSPNNIIRVSPPKRQEYVGPVAVAAQKG